jgi:3-oxoadipate enol-lactonase
VTAGPQWGWPAVERGTGPPVVFLHGYPLDHRMWEPQLESLAQERRIVLIDLPGFGLAADGPVPDTLSGFARALNVALAAHVPGPVVVVGHSFGGYVALQLYRDFPEHFAGLVLTNTRSEPDNDEARARRMATVRRLEVSSESLDVDATVRSLLSPTAWTAGGPLVESVREIVRGARSRAVIPTLKAIAGRPDLTPVLSTIRVPTLVVWGEEDQLIPPPQTQSMVDRIAGARGVAIPGAGHLPSLEAPRPFTDALKVFLGHAARTRPPREGDR